MSFARILRRLHLRRETATDRIAAASAWIDADRARRIAALKAGRSAASAKGWATRRERAGA